MIRSSQGCREGTQPESPSPDMNSNLLAVQPRGQSLHSVPQAGVTLCVPIVPAGWGYTSLAGGLCSVQEDDRMAVLALWLQGLKKAFPHESQRVLTSQLHSASKLFTT